MILGWIRGCRIKHMEKSPLWRANDKLYANFQQCPQLLCCSRANCTLNYPYLAFLLGFPGGSDSKGSTCNAGDLGLIPGLGKIPWRRAWQACQYSCLENPMDGGAWWATVHEVVESDMTEQLNTAQHTGVSECFEHTDFEISVGYLKWKCLVANWREMELKI